MRWVFYDNLEIIFHISPKIFWLWLLIRILFAEVIFKSTHNIFFIENCGKLSFIIKYPPYLSRLMTKPTKWHVRPATTQISLGIRPVWAESSLCSQWVAMDPSFLHADSEDSDQTGRMPWLRWVFVGHTWDFVGFVMRQLICFTVLCVESLCFHLTSLLPDSQQTMQYRRNIPWKS